MPWLSESHKKRLAIILYDLFLEELVIFTGLILFYFFNVFTKLKAAKTIVPNLIAAYCELAFI